MNILDIIKTFWPIILSIVAFIFWLARLELKIKSNETNFILLDGKFCELKKEFKEDFKFLEDNFIKMNDKISYSINEIKEMITELKTIVARLDERTHYRRADDKEE